MKHNSTNFYQGLVLVANTKQGPEIIARVWWYSPPNGSTFEARVKAWSSSGAYSHGTGRAGGYGYDKMGAALIEACEAAGLPAPREGYGAEDREWPEKLAKAIGYHGKILPVWGRP